MKTTLDIDDRLLAAARALAIQQHTTLTCLIEEGLRLRLRVVQRAPHAGKPRLPVFKGCGGLVNGLDGIGNKAMFTALDADDHA